MAIAGDNAKPPLFGANVHWSGSGQHFSALFSKLHMSSGRAALEAFRRSQSDVHINGSVRELVVEHCSRGCAVVQEQAPLVSSGDQSYAEVPPGRSRAYPDCLPHSVLYLFIEETPAVVSSNFP